MNRETYAALKPLMQEIALQLTKKTKSEWTLRANEADETIGGSTPRGMENTMTKSHAAGWVRFQTALCNMGRDSKRYRNILNSQRHRDAVHILGRGTEEELKYEMMQWRFDYPDLFEGTL